MSKMSNLSLEIEELACAGYCSSEIAEIVKYPVEQVESFLEEFELQAMVEVLTDWTTLRPPRTGGTTKTHANMGPQV